MDPSFNGQDCGLLIRVSGFKSLWIHQDKDGGAVQIRKPDTVQR